MKIFMAAFLRTAWTLIKCTALFLAEALLSDSSISSRTHCDCEVYRMNTHRSWLR